jgi:hypothetical protein
MMMHYSVVETLSSQLKWTRSAGLTLFVVMLSAQAVLAQTPTSSQCAARVTSFSLSDAGPSTHITFNIAISVPQSRGSFSYSYIYKDGNGGEHSVDKNSPNWTPSDGQEISLPDDIAVPKSDITSFKVSQESFPCDTVR